MSDLKDLMQALGPFYEDIGILTNPQTAHMVVDGQHLLSLNEIPGVEIQAQTVAGIIDAQLTIAAGTQVPTPIHSCIGMMTSWGTQEIRLRIKLERQAKANLIAHCIFPNVEVARHQMEAEVELEEGAELYYSEGHYHGLSGGMEVIPRARIRVGPRARYFSDFSLTTGQVGELDIDYWVEAGEQAVVELAARVFGHGRDQVRVKDELVLAGDHARGLIKTRVAVEDDASSEVIGITEGKAAGARGHMDCMEIVRGNAEASAEPIVKVSHPLAKITHEAAVGTVDQKQLETLMARGLNPEQAVDVVITGILR